MPGRKREPSYRDLDLYHLVIRQRWKQNRVASLFGVRPSRVSQVIHRVREWVDACLSDWLFPGQDELRFLAALDKRGIRIRDAEEPLHLIIEHTSGCPRYSRTITVTPLGAASTNVDSAQREIPSGAKDSAKVGATVELNPLKFLEPPESVLPSAMPAVPTTSLAGGCM